MLERTAGCLESGSLRRLIPGSKTVAHRRMLHSGFWSHGTADLEVSPLWQALLQVSEAKEAAVMDAPRNDAALEGGAFLDFLYPTGALSLLRQCSPWRRSGLARRRTWTGHSGLGRRSYSTGNGDAKHLDEGQGATAEKNLDGLEALDEVEREFDTEVEQDIEEAPRIDVEPLDQNDRADPLLRIIRDNRSDDYEEAWRQFRALDRNTQLSVTSELLEYFATSERQVDARRLIQLFEDIRETATQSQCRSMIKAHVILGNFEGAMEEHAVAQERYGTLMEADRMLGSLISNSQWNLAYELWLKVQSFVSTHPETESESYELWSYVKDLPDVAERAMKIAEYFSSLVKTDEPGPINSFLGKVLYSALFPKEGVDRNQFVVLFRAWSSLGLDKTHYQKNSARALLELVELKETKLAVNLYQKIREQFGVPTWSELLWKMLGICCRTGDIAVQDMILADWTRLFDTVPSRVYKMCIATSASQGDAERAHELFKIILDRGISKPDGIRGADDFNSLLTVHARRGEVDKCVEIFHQIRDLYGLRHTDKNRNILLSAYGRANFLDEAFKLYNTMVDEKDRLGQPHDPYTVGTIMGIFSQQGDSSGVRYVYERAVASGTKDSTAMLDCLVQSYIRLDELPKAETVCKDAVHKILDRPTTRMWNYLLVAYAMRRDITNVYRIHKAMDDRNVPFDGHTYAALVLALAVGGQPLKAFKIMTEVMPEAGVTITKFHYAIVMGGFIRTKEYEKVITLHKRMLMDRHLLDGGAGFSAGVQQRKAAAILDQRYLEQGSPDEKAKVANEQFYETLATADDVGEAVDSSRKGMKGQEALDIAYLYSKFDYYIFLAGQSRAFDKAKQLSQEFLALVPADRKQAIPLKLYSALMIAQYKEGNHQAVEDTWHMAFDIAKYQARDIRGGSLVLYPRRFDISLMLSTLIQSYRDQNKVAQLKVVISQVTAAGFALDNKNWNLYIQALTRTYTYREAFTLCENKLMPGWLGWQKVRSKELVRNRLDLVTRRKKESPEYLRPVYHTLLFLTKAYLEMEAASGANMGYTHRMKELEVTCPKTLHAVRTMQREGDDLERVVLSDDY